MSSTGKELPPRPKQYRPGTGSDRYARFVRDWLGVKRTYVQDRILAALDQHKQVHVDAANGVGKSFIAAAGGLAALFCNPDTIVNVTAGNSRTLKTNIWKPARSLFRNSPLPGRPLDGSREIQSGFDEKWFFECVSPRYPGDLEGPHNEHVIYIIEEANKPGVTAEHIEAVRSTATDDNDRVLVISNPPRDESNVVADLLRSDQWYSLQFPSWESHNVRVDRGLEDCKIAGLADTSKLIDDWDEHHDAPWPGLNRAIEISSPYLTPDGEPTVSRRAAATDPDGDPVENPEFRTDLSSVWYRRRAGTMPPTDAAVHRPVQVGAVRSAYDRSPAITRKTPSSVGIDVARSSDRTVMTGVHGMDIRVHYDETGTDHEEQKREVLNGTDSSPALAEWPNPEVAVDKGYAPGFYDFLNDRVPHVTDFQNGTLPADETRFKDMWSEALFHFGQFVDEGGSINHSKLREQAVVAAREIEFRERTLQSRGANGAEVLEASSKDVVRDALDEGSPDYLDSALMAVWRERVDPDEEKPSPTW